MENSDKKKTKKLDWEKEFDKNWINPWNRNNFGIPKAHLDIKDFISRTLTQQRTELLEEIKDEIKKSMPVVPIEYKDGWDRCIDYVEQIIEDEIHFTDL